MTEHNSYIYIYMYATEEITGVRIEYVRILDKCMRAAHFVVCMHEPESMGFSY